MKPSDVFFRIILTLVILAAFLVLRGATLGALILETFGFQYTRGRHVPALAQFFAALILLFGIIAFVAASKRKPRV